MPKTKKPTVTVSEPEATIQKVVWINAPIDSFVLNADLGRQDLNETFKKVEDKINELIKKVNN